MSFLKISDPVKRDLIVKKYLETKKNIREITEGLRPITFPPMQPVGEASGEALEKEEP